MLVVFSLSIEMPNMSSRFAALKGFRLVLEIQVQSMDPRPMFQQVQRPVELSVIETE